MKTTTFIYLVTNCYNDPNKVYVGKTKSTRIHQHKKNYGNKINYLIIDEIDSICSKDWKPLECYWIEQFRQWGFDILNKNKGGGGPSIYSDETRLKVSQSNKKHYILGSERNKKISVKNKQIIWSEERKVKHSQILKQRDKLPPVTEETKLKISQANKGKKRTPEMIEVYKQNRLGKKHSPETIEKLKGRIRTEESKLKQSINSKGREITWDLGTKGKNIPQSQKNKISEGNSKPVIQLDKSNQIIQEFKSYTEAKQITGIDPQHCLINKTKSAGGFIWKYKE
tara:strand:- start:172 stop:1020 length:849 start_codon:yes stop_codon:yes gene_type:complete